MVIHTLLVGRRHLGEAVQMSSKHVWVFLKVNFNILEDFVSPLDFDYNVSFTEMQVPFTESPIPKFFSCPGDDKFLDTTCQGPRRTE